MKKLQELLNNEPLDNVEKLSKVLVYKHISLMDCFIVLVNEYI